MLWLIRVLIRSIALLDLLLFTLLMLLLAALPHALIHTIYPRLFQSWCRCFVRALGVQLRLHQHAPLPEQYILIANHPSALEDVGIPALFKVRSLAKIEVRDWFFVGKIAIAAGTLFVRREDKASRQAALAELIAAVNAGDNIAIFPEGGCHGRLLAERFQFGAFSVAFATNTPIVPVFLHHEAQISFEWRANESLLQKIFAIFTSPNPVVHYHVFPALYPADFENKEIFCETCYQHYLAWQKRYLI
ncbi:lysophospholipid acyltransferase family protein [Deefgea piscis]|uniref:lysophospholipid acyltransferase family protein n=1 Tax=Deefgea piscis TaxID=2739061 RepID=UPI001C80A4C9|nr:lysophospholipid acyltransferase family protein [Deefgea piscis]QZA80768.1 1-acyl-sn-glycerol-3-phosphate acyltransferase [Deefgea piscis]